MHWDGNIDKGFDMFSFFSFHGSHWSVRACVPLVGSRIEWPCLSFLSGQVFDPEIPLLRIFLKERIGQGHPDFCGIIYNSRQIVW